MRTLAPKWVLAARDARRPRAAPPIDHGRLSERNRRAARPCPVRGRPGPCEDGLMTRPQSRQQAAAMSAAFAGAIDLSALKSRPAAPAPSAPGGPVAGTTSDSPYVRDVTEATFGDIVQLSSQVLIVVDLWAEWCEPCKQLSPVLERLAAAGGGAWILAKVDVDANPRIAQAFGVQTIPTVVAIAGGQPVDAFSGAQPEPQIRQWISGMLEALKDRLPGIAAAQQDGNGAAAEPEVPEDPRFVAAEEALTAGDFAKAVRAYEEILAAEPANIEAQAALGQAQFLARVATHDPNVVQRAEALPDDVPTQCAAADVDLAEGRTEQAFTRMIDTVRRTAGDDRSAAREHLLGLFALFPPDEDEVIKARRALAAALY